MNRLACAFTVSCRTNDSCHAPSGAGRSFLLPGPARTSGNGPLLTFPLEIDMTDSFSISTDPAHTAVVDSRAARVQRLLARVILDSRGLPTIEVTIELGGVSAAASVPSGKSTGRYEALERRDGDRRRFGGKGVLGAVGAVNGEIAEQMQGEQLPPREQLDRWLKELDGTPNKSRLGANAILAVALAAARARSVLERRPLFASLAADATLLPVPCLNVINGGAHAPNELDFQEFMLVPAGFDRYADALRAGAETYQALDWIMRAIERAGYQAGSQLFIALDPAASGFHADGQYRFADQRLDAGAMTAMYADWLGRYPIVSVEDGLAEDDAAGWKHLTATLGSRVQLVGDDIFVSDPGRIRWGIDESIANAVLLKPNQIGTVTEVFDATRMAQDGGYRLMMSHRSGETDDSFIADLAVALGTGQIKAGAPARGERLAKYNQLLRIEETLGDRATFGGVRAFHSGA
jgi:enolase